MSDRKEVGIAGIKTSIAKGGLGGVAVIGGERTTVRALGKYVVCRAEVGNEFSAGGLAIPASKETRKIIVENVGPDVKMDIKHGDRLVVMGLTEIPIWNPDTQGIDMYCIYAEEHIMGVIE